MAYIYIRHGEIAILNSYSHRSHMAVSHIHLTHTINNSIVNIHVTCFAVMSFGTHCIQKKNYLYYYILLICVTSVRAKNDVERTMCPELWCEYEYDM